MTVQLPIALRSGGRFSVADIRRMVEDGLILEDDNFELIDGEIVPMASKGNHHEVVKAELNEALARLKPADVRLAVETSVYFDGFTFLEPDFCLYPKRLLPEDVRGTDLLLAIEVAASSLGYDCGRKAQVYSRHLVPEFWVVDAVRRVTWVYREPGGDGTWGSMERVESEQPLVCAALPALTIVLAELS